MATYIKIQTVTVGAGGAANMTFSSILNTYTDLKVVVSSRIDAGGSTNFLRISLNGSTANFTTKAIGGNGASAFSYGETNFLGETNPSGTTALTFANLEAYFPNYLSSNNKSFSADAVAENNATTAQSSLVAGLWSNTAAISSIGIIPNSGSFVQYTTATLYGIKKS